ncbi:MAG: ABC transporter permease [Chloroflexi bacterium]|nr:ABC transporter permease [Chloroflexota bacterium]
MGRYLIQRIFQSLFTLIMILIAVFVLMHMVGDPVALLLPEEATLEQRAAVRTRYGCDRPLYVQAADYFGGLVKGDFGNSIRYNEPAMGLVLSRVPKTATLGAIAFAIALLGIPLGILAATRPRSVVDVAINVGAFAFVSVPGFWLALMMILVFAIAWGWLPTSGFGGYTGFKYMIMPAIVISVGPLARFSQLTRTAMLEELSKQYVVTARAKGLSQPTVLYVHTLKNASIAVVTLAGSTFVGLFNGAVIVETVFGWPGVGQMIVGSIQQRDMQVVIAAIVMLASLVIVVNFTVDMIYGLLDPRIKYS